MGGLRAGSLCVCECEEAGYIKREVYCMTVRICTARLPPPRKLADVTGVIMRPPLLGINAAADTKWSHQG